MEGFSPVWPKQRVFNNRHEHRTVFYTRVSGELLRFSLDRAKGGNDGPQIGIEHERGTLQIFCLGRLGLVARSSEQIAAVELDGEVRILEDVSGQDEDDGLAGLDKSASAELLKSGERDCRSRFAADAIGANFGFGGGDFDLSNLFDLATGRLEHPQRLLPRCGIADAYGGGERLGGHGFELPPPELAHAAIERIRALRLDDGKLGTS